MSSKKNEISSAESRFVSSLIASGIAELATLPTDVAKVRLQVQTSLSSTAPKYKGMFHCIFQIQREEGTLALWKGWKPALLRQCCYSSLSLVLYEPIRNFFTADRQPTFLQRLLSGGTAGALSILAFNWTEVVKTKMQTNLSSTTESIVSTVRRIYTANGLRATLFAGVEANVMRTFLVNAAELGTYDEVKSVLLTPVLGDGGLSHLGASGIAGVASALVSTPADVIKTRLMNQAGESKSLNPITMFGKILKEEKPSAFYKGFIPICVRKVIWCTVFFVSYEQIKSSFN
eukprot:snap_masked-scaffold_4-processed-gene-7.30-mRNA-1 protein AED:0.18 eAED:0.18 QI:0/-1/0/1/-1/1/1/0/288